MSQHPKSTFFPDSFHRVTVKALVVKDNKILLLKEPSKLSGKWELPGGGLDFGEEIYEGLRREVEEEIGIKVKSIEKRPMYVWTWRYEKNARGIGWYYSLVVAYRVELEDFNFNPTEECEDIGWFSKEELNNIELSGQANSLKNIFRPQDFKI